MFRIVSRTAVAILLGLLWAAASARADAVHDLSLESRPTPGVPLQQDEYLTNNGSSAIVAAVHWKTYDGSARLVGEGDEKGIRLAPGEMKRLDHKAQKSLNKTEFTITEAHYVTTP